MCLSWSRKLEMEDITSEKQAWARLKLRQETFAYLQMNHRNMIFPCHRETCHFGMTTGRIIDLWGEDYVDFHKYFCLADRCDKLWHSPSPTASASLVQRPSHSNLISFVCLWTVQSPGLSRGGHQGLLSSSPFHQVNELDRFLVFPQFSSWRQ